MSVEKSPKVHSSIIEEKSPEEAKLQAKKTAERIRKKITSGAEVSKTRTTEAFGISPDVERERKEYTNDDKDALKTQEIESPRSSIPSTEAAKEKIEDVTSQIVNREEQRHQEDIEIVEGLSNTDRHKVEDKINKQLHENWREEFRKLSGGEKLKFRISNALGRRLDIFGDVMLNTAGGLALITVGFGTAFILTSSVSIPVLLASSVATTAFNFIGFSAFAGLSGKLVSQLLKMAGKDVPKQPRKFRFFE